jgi:hypothetical protein
MSNLNETLDELKEINKHLSTISTLLQQKDQKLDESLNVIRKDLWNIKNIISDETAHNKNLEGSIEKAIEKALVKAMAYIFVAGVMLYIVGRFLL